MDTDHLLLWAVADHLILRDGLLTWSTLFTIIEQKTSEYYLCRFYGCHTQFYKIPQHLKTHIYELLTYLVVRAIPKIHKRRRVNLQVVRSKFHNGVL